MQATRAQSLNFIESHIVNYSSIIIFRRTFLTLLPRLAARAVFVLAFGLGRIGTADAVGLRRRLRRGRGCSFFLLGLRRALLLLLARLLLRRAWLWLLLLVRLLVILLQLVAV